MRNDAPPAARTFDEVDSVQLWRLFLDDPAPFFQELFSDDDDSERGEP